MTRSERTSCQALLVCGRRNVTLFGEHLALIIPGLLVSVCCLSRVLFLTCAAPSIAPSAGGLPEQQEIVIMTRLQIAMSREIGGWPLYGIVMAAGQVDLSALLLIAVLISSCRC